MEDSSWEPTALSKIRHEGHDHVGNHGGQLGRTSESSEPSRGESTAIYLIASGDYCIVCRPTIHHGSRGFRTGTCVLVKSPTFRETIVRLWWIAVAANKPSMADKGLPLLFAFAASKAQRSATAASIDRILPEKRACSSTSSHVSRRLRLLPCGSAAKPFRISPSVRTLK